MPVTRADLEQNRARKALARSSLAPELLSDEDLEASLRRTLWRHTPGADLWLFGYGSLVWNPSVRFLERGPAMLHGYHRRFCLWSRINRGTPERPGLALGLDSGGCCRGVVFRIPGAEVEAELRILWRRADIIRRSIFLASLSLLLAACLIITLFAAALLRWDAGAVLICLFAGCLVALIGSLVLFIWDVNQALAALRLELQDALEQKKAG